MKKKTTHGGDIISSNCRIAIVISAGVYGALRWRGREINLCREFEKIFPKGVMIDLKSKEWIGENKE